MKAKLLKATGEVVEIEPKNGTDFTLEELYEHLNCSIVEVIALDEDNEMFFDEEGKFNLKEVNTNATMCAQKNQAIASWDYIVGDAIVCNSKMVK